MIRLGEQAVADVTTNVARGEPLTALSMRLARLLSRFVTRRLRN